MGSLRTARLVPPGFIVERMFVETATAVMVVRSRSGRVPVLDAVLDLSAFIAIITGALPTCR